MLRLLNLLPSDGISIAFLDILCPKNWRVRPPYFYTTVWLFFVFCPNNSASWGWNWCNKLPDLWSCCRLRVMKVYNFTRCWPWYCVDVTDQLSAPTVLLSLKYFWYRLNRKLTGLCRRQEYVTASMIRTTALTIFSIRRIKSFTEYLTLKA
jgi:hypothetical protein